MDYKDILNKNALKIIESLKEKMLYFSEIYEKTRIKSRNNLLKNLSQLVSAKILNKEEKKGNTYYSLNYDSNVAIALLNLINMSEFSSLPFERRKAIEESVFAAKPALSIIFGSSAKGNFREKSDIDIIFVYNNLEKEYLKKIEKDIKKIGQRYGININPSIMDFNEFDIRKDPIRHILKTGYPLTGERYFYNEARKI